MAVCKTTAFGLQITMKEWIKAGNNLVKIRMSQLWVAMACKFRWMIEIRILCTQVINLEIITE